VTRAQLKASILATDIAKPNKATVTVFNPTPGGGTSNAAFFEITRPTSSLALITSGVRAGSNPVSAEVGDFNGDGKLDLVVANAGSKNVSVILGNGDGTFKAPLNSRASTTISGGRRLQRRRQARCGRG
jgi:ethanolamine utilization protein EutA (predicted chaperonin)